jgi:ferric-dicitrate binding protein FerR (iron transport regulator)
MSDSFEKLLDEVRSDLGTQAAKSVDWDSVDAGLFARIDRERQAERARFAAPRRRGMVLATAGLAAAAAIVAVLVGKGREPLDLQGAAPPESAGTLLSVEGGGSVLIDGKVATSGATLHLGDVVETRGARATLERPGKLSLALEPDSRTTVTHVRGALVLALERGAVEAQVVPVPAGEAFAVDVDGSRVAVHGTHLRVARAGSHAVVDLTEGVVSIGEAPRAGSVVGTLVNAPAHVEFEAADAAGTLTQTHDPAAVRPAVRPAAVAMAPLLPRHVEPESTPVHASTPSPGEPRAEVHAAAGAPARPAASAADASPQETIAAAVRACMAERPRADNVTVVVNTALHLEVGDDGAVRAARFDPPVAPDVNECAARAIYRERFAHPGSVSIAIDFQY